MKTFPLDSKAPPKKEKKYPNLPWCCQHMCAGYCSTREFEFECPPDKPTPKPKFFRNGVDR